MPHRFSGLGELALSGVYVMGKSWRATGKRIIGLSPWCLVRAGLLKSPGDGS